MVPLVLIEGAATGYIFLVICVAARYQQFDWQHVLMLVIFFYFLIYNVSLMLAIRKEGTQSNLIEHIQQDAKFLQSSEIELELGMV